MSGATITGGILGILLGCLGVAFGVFMLYLIARLIISLIHFLDRH